MWKNFLMKRKGLLANKAEVLDCMRTIQRNIFSVVRAMVVRPRFYASI